MAIAIAAGKQLSACFCLWPQSLKLFQHDLQTFSSPTSLQLPWSDAEVFLNLKRDMISPVYSGSNLRSPPGRRCLKHLIQKEALWSDAQITSAGL